VLSIQCRWVVIGREAMARKGFCEFDACLTSRGIPRIQRFDGCCVFRDPSVLFAGRSRGVSLAVGSLEYPRSVTPRKYRDFPN
jgi:hypothetical protein